MEQRLRELLAKWRRLPTCDDPGGGYEEGAFDQLHNCADELEAALTPSAPVAEWQCTICEGTHSDAGGSCTENHCSWAAKSGAAAPVAEAAPQGETIYMLREPDGSLWWNEEICVFSTKADADESCYLQNDSEDDEENAKWQVVEFRDAASPATKPAPAELTEAKGQDETGWVIERRGMLPVEYVCASSAGFDFTQDNLKAIRFCRREDANQVAEILDDEDVAIVEHMWCQP